MPVVGSRAPQGELIRLQEELFDEIQKDSAEIAPHIFGEADNQPDLASVPNERLDAVYRQAYEKNDREFLQREARRDPQQFLKVAERLGVTQTPPQQQPVVPPPVPMPPMLPAPGIGGAQPVSPVPLAAPAMPVAPLMPGAPAMPAAPPVILGPNGQPLPPMGV